MCAHMFSQTGSCIQKHIFVFSVVFLIWVGACICHGFSLFESCCFKPVRVCSRVCVWTCKRRAWPSEKSYSSVADASHLIGKARRANQRQQIRPSGCRPIAYLGWDRKWKKCGGKTKKRAKGELTKEQNKCKHKRRDSVEILKSTQEDKSCWGNVGKSLKENLSFLLQAGH